MSIEEKFEKLKEWCNSTLMANLDNKYNVWYRDVYPYKSGEQPAYPSEPRSVRPVISRPLVGQTTWKCYLPENINGKQIHNLQILRNTYQPWKPFELKH